MMYIFLIIALFVLIFGSITDLRKREVPDWVNYGLIFTGVALNALLSVVSASWVPILASGIGLGIGMAVAFSMYYLGQWGGGDAKMMMGLGALIGFIFADMFLINFIINSFVLGAVYGLSFGAYLAFRKRKEFISTFRKINSKFPKIFKIPFYLFVFIPFLFTLVLFLLTKNFIILYLTAISFLMIPMYFMYVFAKSIEKCCMLKYVSPSELTEGDWIAKVIKINGKYVCGPKDLGIVQKQINILKKNKIKKILIKDGIPFVPSFLISFVFTLVFGNVFLMMFNVF